jgi:hypothetical protein
VIVRVVSSGDTWEHCSCGRRSPDRCGLESTHSPARAPARLRRPHLGSVLGESLASEPGDVAQQGGAKLGELGPALLKDSEQRFRRLAAGKTSRLAVTRQTHTGAGATAMDRLADEGAIGADGGPQCLASARCPSPTASPAQTPMPSAPFDGKPELASREASLAHRRIDWLGDACCAVPQLRRASRGGDTDEERRGLSHLSWGHGLLESESPYSQLECRRRPVCRPRLSFTSELQHSGWLIGLALQPLGMSPGVLLEQGGPKFLEPWRWVFERGEDRLAFGDVEPQDADLVAVRPFEPRGEFAVVDDAGELQDEVVSDGDACEPHRHRDQARRTYVRCQEDAA